ncbi:MAG: DUF4221 domain-containing protein [Mongoliibacter sp.]|uniref:DUF4221 family protein n=1 Tax=Mongoliibacter sp. TaxID=2022438 RepID=UPI0012F1CC1B|nr:DUF4221 family protein [Mongoliibacter sp.]TVP54644.1 MAG: DUF4221 domain-containing protein [Mongoliibacter sp.]
MTKNYFLLISLSFLLFACQNSKNNETAGAQWVFEIVEETISLKLPEGWGHFGHKFFSTEERIFLFNYGRNSLASYDKNKLELLGTFVFEKEGPNGIAGGVADISVENDSSFWVISQTEKLYHLDSRFQLIDSQDLNTEELMKMGVSPMTFAFVKSGDKLYHPAMPLQFKWTDLSVKEIATMPNLVEYDIENRTYKELNKFDLEFLGDNLNKMIIPTSVALGKNNEIIINHNYRNIYVYHNGETKKFPAMLSDFSKDLPVSSTDMFEDMNEIMKIINYSDIYESVTYFPEQEIYVRNAKFAESPEGGIDADGQFLQSKWGLVFLDENFEKLGELILPEKAANGNYVFENQEGIWYSTDHPDNPDIDEEVMQFKLIQRAD